MNANKDYLSSTLRTFLEDTAAKSPTPGGGSVAALVGSLASALGHMAIAYTVGRPKYAQHESRLVALQAELVRAGEMFNQLMGEDMAAYERFSSARKTGDAHEQQRAIATAVAVPMEIVVLGGAIVARLDEIKECVNPHLYSDMQSAAVLACAAAEAAGTNVRVNLKELGDRQEAARLEAQLDRLVGRARDHRDVVLSYRPQASH